MDFKLTRTLRLLFLAIAIFGFIIFFYQGEIKNRKALKRFKLYSVHGIVSDVKIFDNARGFPSYYIDGEWIHFGIIGEKVENFILVNDSLSKRPGTDTIRVYRKNEGGKWLLIKAR